jgi:hypothetical protein
VPASVSNPALGAVSSNPEAVVSSATVRVNSIVHKMTRPTWLIVLLSIVGCIIIIAVIIAIPALQKNSWANANNAKLNTIIGNFNVDNNAANTAVSIGNSNGLRIACIELGAGADKLQALPAYPISKTQTELDIAIAEIKQGSSECSQAISQKNSTALVKASKEIQAGMSSLSKAVTAIGATGTTSS